MRKSEIKPKFRLKIAETAKFKKVLQDVKEGNEREFAGMKPSLNN
jgi:hypothetical protein